MEDKNRLNTNLKLLLHRVARDKTSVAVRWTFEITIISIYLSLYVVAWKHCGQFSFVVRACFHATTDSTFLSETVRFLSKNKSKQYFTESRFRLQLNSNFTSTLTNTRTNLAIYPVPSMEWSYSLMIYSWSTIFKSSQVSTKYSHNLWWGWCALPINYISD